LHHVLRLRIVQPGLERGSINELPVSVEEILPAIRSFQSFNRLSNDSRVGMNSLASFCTSLCVFVLKIYSYEAAVSFNKFYFFSAFWRVGFSRRAVIQDCSRSFLFQVARSIFADF